MEEKKAEFKKVSFTRPTTSNVQTSTPNRPTTQTSRNTNNFSSAQTSKTNSTSNSDSNMGCVGWTVAIVVGAVVFFILSML